MQLLREQRLHGAGKSMGRRLRETGAAVLEVTRVSGRAELYYWGKCIDKCVWNVVDGREHRHYFSRVECSAVKDVTLFASE